MNASSCQMDRGGRPPSGDPATIVVTLRVSPSEWIALRDLAESNQQRLSEFLRSAINAAALDCRDSPVLADRRSSGS